MYDEFLDFIFPLAKGAGEIQLAYFRGNDLGIETKSNAYDVVTRADKESEAYIVQAILGRYPGHGILGEEGGVMGTAGSDYRWVIDRSTARPITVRGCRSSRCRSHSSTRGKPSPGWSMHPTSGSYSGRRKAAGLT